MNSRIYSIFLQTYEDNCRLSEADRAMVYQVSRAQFLRRNIVVTQNFDIS